MQGRQHELSSELVEHLQRKYDRSSSSIKTRTEWLSDEITEVQNGLKFFQAEGELQNISRNIDSIILKISAFNGEIRLHEFFFRAVEGIKECFDVKAVVRESKRDFLSRMIEASSDIKK